MTVLVTKANSDYWYKIRVFNTMEDIQKVYDFLNKANEFYLATIEGDQPRVRVYGASLLFEGKLYFMAIKGTEAPNQLEKNPKFEICIFKNNVLRMSGKLVMDNRLEIREALVQKIPALGMSIGTENMIMYYVKDADASFYNLQGVYDSAHF